jgi:hypothetical protein
LYRELNRLALSKIPIYLKRTVSESSADIFSSGQVNNVPHAKMIYDNKAYAMSTFVLANGGEMKKITIPSASPQEDGSNPPLPIRLGNTVHFQFDKELTK